MTDGKYHTDEDSTLIQAHCIFRESYIFRGVTLPDHLQESLDAYVTDGRPLGDFLRACVSNSLFSAFGFADDESVAALPAIVGYIYNVLPIQSNGSPEAYLAWLEKKHKERT